MSKEVIEERARELSSKFDYAITSMCFAALALSYQFSPSAGFRFPDLLIFAWILFAISGLIGGWRLMYDPVFYRMNAVFLHLDSFIKQREVDLQNPRFKQMLESKQVLDSDDMKPLTVAAIEKNLKEEREMMEQAKRNLDGLNRKFPVMLKVQVWALIVALSANATYIAVNFCSKAGCLAWII